MAERVAKDYWDRSWEAEASLPQAFTHDAAGLRGVFRRQFDAFFVGQFGRFAPPGSTLMEVGCGRSQLLPYFATRFGLKVAGLDYSEVGCDMARRILARENVTGDIHCGDLWTYDRFPAPGYDVVFSFGLVEHFEDTANIVRGLARFARPGGRVLTLIPNMRGAVGVLQKVLSREIYDIHVPLSVEMLIQGHLDAGLTIESSGYLLPAHFGVCNPGTRLDGSGLSGAWRGLAYRAAIVGSTAMLWAHERLFRLPSTAWLSPYSYAIARRDAP